MKLSPEQIKSAANSEFSRFAGLYDCEAAEHIANLVRQKAKDALLTRVQKDLKHLQLTNSGGTQK